MSRSLLKSTTSCPTHYALVPIPAKTIASCPTDPATTLASVNGSRGHSTSPAWCLCIQNPPLPILSFHVFSNRRHVLDIASLAGCLPNAPLSSHQKTQFVMVRPETQRCCFKVFLPGATLPPPICLDPKSLPQSSRSASQFPSPGYF